MPGAKTDLRTILGAVTGCMESALGNATTAAACRQRLEAIAPPAAGRKIAIVLQRLGRMPAAQVRMIRDWPEAQVQLLKAAMIEACRIVETGQKIRCRVVARLGAPRALGIELSEDGYLEVTFVGPVLV